MCTSHSIGCACVQVECSSSEGVTVYVRGVPFQCECEGQEVWYTHFMHTCIYIHKHTVLYMGVCIHNYAIAIVPHVQLYTTCIPTETYTVHFWTHRTIMAVYTCYPITPCHAYSLLWTLLTVTLPTLAPSSAPPALHSVGIPALHLVYIM